MRSLIATALAAMLTAGAAQAGVYVIPFTMTGGSWVQTLGSAGPYGLSTQPTISGSVTIDTCCDETGTIPGASQFTALSYTTGAKTWTLSDINPISYVSMTQGVPNGFAIVFGSLTGGNVISTLGAAIDDGTNAIICIDCNSATFPPPPPPIPEPRAWLLVLLGVAGLGAELRGRRKVQTAPAWSA